MKKLIFLISMGLAAPASAATLVDTGTPATLTTARPVNNDTVLLGQFSLASATQLESIETFGRVVTAGSALYSIYSSVGDVPGTLLFSASKSFDVTNSLSYYGISGLSWNLLSGSYFVALGQSTSSFTSYVAGSAPNPLGIEGSFKPRGYVPTNQVDLAWRLGGTSMTAAIPEPATWFMMLAGFGIIGSAMRSKRRTGKPATA